MDFDKEMEKKFDDLFWYVLNEQTQQLNKSEVTDIYAVKKSAQKI